MRKDWLAHGFAAIACAITIILQQELILLFLIAGALGIFVFYRRIVPTRPPPSARSVDDSTDWNVKPTTLAAIASGGFQAVALPKTFWFFFKTGFLVFGSGLVVVPFLKAYVVDQYHWLSNQAFLDAIAVGIVSPGPVVITATFVGYLNGDLAGALASTAGIFAPSLIFVLLGTPILRRYRSNGRLQGFIRGVTVAVVGVLVGTSYIVARSSIHDAIGIAILIAALVLLWSRWKIPEPALVGAGGICGLIIVMLH